MAILRHVFGPVLTRHQQQVDGYLEPLHHVGAQHLCARVNQQKNGLAKVCRRVAAGREETMQGMVSEKPALEHNACHAFVRACVLSRVRAREPGCAYS